MNDEEFGAWAKKIRVTYSPEEASRLIEAGPERDVDGLAATIRDTLNWAKARTVTGTPEFRFLVTASEALDALVALTRDLERRLEVAEIMDMSATATQWEGAFKNERRRAEAAEERASQLEHDRDECVKGREAYSRLGSQARREADQLRAERDDAWERNKQTRADLEAARDALEAIDAWHPDLGVGYEGPRNLARAALAGVQAKGRP